MIKFQRLPLEILSLVFFHCLSEPYHDELDEELEQIREGDSPIAKLCPILLTCREWHAVATNTPSLWADLHSSWARLTPELLKRSKRARINVCWNCDIEDDNAISALTLMLNSKETVARIDSFRLLSYDQNMANIIGYLQHLDELEENYLVFQPRVVSLRSSHGSSKLIIRTRFLELLAGAVEELDLGPFLTPLPIQGSFPFLRKLELVVCDKRTDSDPKATLSDIHAMLFRMKKLNSLECQEICCSLPVGSYRGGEGLLPSLPQLNELALTANAMSSPIITLASLLSRGPTASLSINTAWSEQDGIDSILEDFFSAADLLLNAFRPVFLSLTRKLKISFNCDELEVEMASPIKHFGLKVRWTPPSEGLDEERQLLPIIFHRLCNSPETAANIRAISIDSMLYLPMLSRILQPASSDTEENQNSDALIMPDLAQVTLHCSGWYDLGLNEGISPQTRLAVHLIRFAMTMTKRQVLQKNIGGVEAKKLDLLRIECFYDLRMGVRAVESVLQDVVDTLEVNIGEDYSLQYRRHSELDQETEF